MQERGLRSIQAHDPTVHQASAIFNDFEVAADPCAAAEDADVLVILTEWDQFRWLDLERVSNLMRPPAIIDTGNLLDPTTMRRQGFTYEGVGRR